jgi:hypothetical protein
MLYIQYVSEIILISMWYQIKIELWGNDYSDTEPAHHVAGFRILV